MLLVKHWLSISIKIERQSHHNAGETLILTTLSRCFNYMEKRKLKVTFFPLWFETWNRKIVIHSHCPRFKENKNQNFNVATVVQRTLLVQLKFLVSWSIFPLMFSPDFIFHFTPHSSPLSFISSFGEHWKRNIEINANFMIQRVVHSFSVNFEVSIYTHCARYMTSKGSYYYYYFN